MKHKRGQVILSNFILLIIFLVATFASGIIASVVYYDMKIMNTTLHQVDFQIPIQENATSINDYKNISTFQDILEIVVYPILGLADSLPYLTYFMIFGLIIALAITAYVSSKNPVFFVLHLLFTLLVTYFCNILSNSYSNILSNSFMNTILIDFPVYNKVMLYLPQIVFFTSILFGLIAFISILKPQSNLGGNQQGLNYGGDY